MSRHPMHPSPDPRAARLAPASPWAAPTGGTTPQRLYDRDPRYEPVGGAVDADWEPIARSVSDSTAVLSVDGPWVLPWDRVVTAACSAFTGLGRRPRPIDVRDAMLPWSDITELTASPRLADDPEFSPLCQLDLAQLFGSLPTPRRVGGELTIVFGPGAALIEHDELWYADLPKRHAEAATLTGRASNLGQRDQDGGGTTRRLFFIDWPVLDRHRAAIAPRIDRYIDVQDDIAASIDGRTLRRTLKALAVRPFRTRPSFNSTSWGGHWAERELGFPARGGNTAIGYELIAPESGIAIGGAHGPTVEIPFDLLVRQQPREVQGDEVSSRFGASFPIRFDYLDTVGGGHLSVHCHPRDDDMRQVFGWPYGQHESYYVMVSPPDGIIHLGLRDDVDISAFRAAAATAETTGTPFDITRHVQTFPATPHQLFLIPAGTPHGSGSGSVVLEISATPYLYSLRFYDWMRRDTRGHQRPVHVEHAFRNLDIERRGRAVPRDLMQGPRVLRRGDGWTEELLGRLPELFFEIRRMTIEPGARVMDRTDGRFRVVNVVHGDGAVVETLTGFQHTVAYAETLVIPAAVGRYSVQALGGRGVRILDARVR